MTVNRQPQFDENGQQTGEVIRCTPNNEATLSEAERRYCDSLKQKQQAMNYTDNNEDNQVPEFHIGSSTLLDDDANANNVNDNQWHQSDSNKVLKHYGLMKMITGGGNNSTNDHYIYGNMLVMTKDTPEFHKASAYVEDLSQDNKFSSSNNNNNSNSNALKHYELVKRIAYGASSPFQM
jgi:hypothetical protein